MSETLKKKTIQRTVWSQQMENLLLDLWEEKIEELRGARKNSHIYQEMATVIQDAGFIVTWTDIRTKMDNLTLKYRIEKSKVGPTGGTPSSWEHYTKLHHLLGSFKLQNIELSMLESTDMSTLTAENLAASCSSCGPNDFERSLPPKKRKVDINAELVTIAKERIDIIKQQHQEKIEQINEMVKRLDTISNQNAEFQNQLLEILRAKK